MKIALVQSRPIKGDIRRNIDDHIKWIKTAATNDADVIMFPELSITGYEPTLAKNLATSKDDPRFNELQKLSNSHNMTICVGMPLKAEGGINIGMIVFQPEQPRIVYAKKYLHEDEEPYFISGNQFPVLTIKDHPVSFAICYELSIPRHSQTAYENKGAFYVASVAKTPEGAEKACETLSAIAKQYSMFTFMANCVGHCDNFDCGGLTSAWNNQGKLIEQLSEDFEGILIFDSSSNSTSILPHIYQ